MRSRRSEQLAPPEWLRRIITSERADFDWQPILGQLTQGGVTSFDSNGQPDRPDQLLVSGPGLPPLFVNVRRDTSATPTSDALTNLASYVERLGLLRRLHSAWVDLWHVADTARYLAEYAHSKDPVRSPPPQSPTAMIGPLSEVGIIVMYARSFTGRARLGGRWLPANSSHRALHDEVIRARGSDHAHADWTDSRTMIDHTAVSGVPGPPVLAEMRSRLSREKLLAIAELAEAQRNRFYEVTRELKAELGFANSTAESKDRGPTALDS